MGAILVVGIVALLAGAGVVTYGVQEEYIPLNLSVREPIDSKGVSIQDIDTEYQVLLEEIENKGITYRFFTSTASIPEIQRDYDQQLLSSGYSHDYSGTKTVGNAIVTYEGYMKGFTAAGILITSGDYFVGGSDENMVIYATGAQSSFFELYNEYFEN